MDTRSVKPKKHLGQHFLKDLQAARRIVDLIPADFKGSVVEIGPGTGVLTNYLIESCSSRLNLIEIDQESIRFLRENYPKGAFTIIEGDVLKTDFSSFGDDIFVIGNFPYNISSQIFFHLISNRHRVKGIVAMLQKEVADRLAGSSGSKEYGILSVWLQLYFTVKRELIVEPGAFFPPPKVRSAVISCIRNNRIELDCNEAFLLKVIKQGFNNRRKTLRNALKPLLGHNYDRIPYLDKRAEQLNCDEFILLTQAIENTPLHDQSSH